MVSFCVNPALQFNLFLSQAFQNIAQFVLCRITHQYIQAQSRSTIHLKFFEQTIKKLDCLKGIDDIEPYRG